MQYEEFSFHSEKSDGSLPGQAGGSRGEGREQIESIQRATQYTKSLEQSTAGQPLPSHDNHLVEEDMEVSPHQAQDDVKEVDIHTIDDVYTVYDIYTIDDIYTTDKNKYPIYHTVIQKARKLTPISSDEDFPQRCGRAARELSSQEQAELSQEIKLRKAEKSEEIMRWEQERAGKKNDPLSKARRKLGEGSSTAFSQNVENIPEEDIKFSKMLNYVNSHLLARLQKRVNENPVEWKSDVTRNLEILDNYKSGWHTYNRDKAAEALKLLKRSLDGDPSQLDPNLTDLRNSLEHAERVMNSYDDITRIAKRLFH